MKNLYKYILSFVVAFVFGLLVFQPKIYAMTIDEITPILNDFYSLHSIEDFPYIFVTTAKNSSTSCNIIISSIEPTLVGTTDGYFIRPYDYNYSYYEYYYKPYNKTSFTRFYNSSQQFIDFRVDYHLIFSNYNAYEFTTIPNSILINSKNFDFPPQPTNVADIYGQAPDYQSIITNKNYLLVFDDNEEFRKYKLYVSSSPFYLTANEDKLLGLKGNLNIVNELSNMLELYQTTSDGTAWEVVSHNLNSLTIYDKYSYLYDEKGANRLINSLSRFSVSFEEFYNVLNHGNVNYLDIKPTNSDLYNRVYINSSDIPTSSQEPSQQIISSDKLDFLPESYDNSINANEYPYIIYVYNVNDSNEYTIIGSDKALCIANNDYWPTGFVYKSLFPIFVETWETGDIKIKYFRHLSNNYSDTKQVILTSSSLDGNCYLVSPVATGYSTDTDGNIQYYARLKSNYNLYRADKNIYNSWFTSGDTIIKKEDIPSYSDEDSGIVSSIINTLGLKLQQWFVPSDNSWTISYNLIMSKFPFLENFTILKDTLSSVSDTSDPTLYIDFSKSVNGEFVGYSGTINLLDLSWYKQEYRSQVKAFTSVIVTIFFLISIVKALPNVLGGDSTLLGTIKHNINMKGD